MTPDPKIPLEDSQPAAVGTGLVPAPEGKSLVGSQIRPSATRHATLQVWLHRAAVLLFVFVCAVVGVLLVILPWHPEWTDNRLLLGHPNLRSLVSSGFVRGACSGLGLLDIWIGFWEAIHYHEDARS